MATPTELGKIFLDNFPVDTNGYSKEVTIDELVTINPDFRTKNGCHWARSEVIQQLDKEGKFIAQYNSAQEAAQFLGLKDKSGICRAARTHGTSCGYRWEYL